MRGCGIQKKFQCREGGFHLCELSILGPSLSFSVFCMAGPLKKVILDIIDFPPQKNKRGVSDRRMNFYTLGKWTDGRTDRFGTPVNQFRRKERFPSSSTNPPSPYSSVYGEKGSLLLCSFLFGFFRASFTTFSRFFRVDHRGKSRQFSSFSVFFSKREEQINVGKGAKSIMEISTLLERSFLFWETESWRKTKKKWLICISPASMKRRRGEKGLPPSSRTGEGKTSEEEEEKILTAAEEASASPINQLLSLGRSTDTPQSFVPKRWQKNPLAWDEQNETTPASPSSSSSSSSDAKGLVRSHRRRPTMRWVPRKKCAHTLSCPFSFNVCVCVGAKPVSKEVFARSLLSGGGKRETAQTQSTLGIEVKERDGLLPKRRRKQASPLFFA